MRTKVITSDVDRQLRDNVHPSINDGVIVPSRFAIVALSDYSEMLIDLLTRSVCVAAACSGVLDKHKLFAYIRIVMYSTTSQRLMIYLLLYYHLLCNFELSTRLTMTISWKFSHMKCHSPTINVNIHSSVVVIFVNRTITSPSPMYIHSITLTTWVQKCKLATTQTAETHLQYDTLQHQQC